MDYKKARILYIIITILLFNEMSMNVHARNNSKSKPKEQAVGLRTNICDITDNDPKVHCQCENTRESQNVTVAECWVFNGDIASNDPIWKSFASLPNLQSLSFNIRIDGSLRYVPTEILSNLQRLKSINIKYANIEDVTPFSFANMTNLEETLLMQNQIKTLQKYAFAYLPNITTIDLEDNKIIQIGHEAFVELPKLQKLIFTQNNISIIQNGTFQHTYNLLELNLNNNSIYNLNRRTFDGLANLRKLDLRQNRIHILANFTFSELWNLQVLLLGKNDLRYISERAFDGMSELRTLSLSENQLASLPSTLFQGIRMVSALNLRSNELQVLTFDHIEPIIENLRPSNSSLFLEDNNFVCDCRLKWMHELRTNTKSQFTKYSLDRVTCTMDRKKIYVNQKKTIPIPGQMVKTGIKGKAVKKLGINILKISPKNLPCPRENKETTETPRKSHGYATIPKQNKKETSSTHGLKRRLDMLVYCIMSFTFFLT